MKRHQPSWWKKETPRKVWENPELQKNSVRPTSRLKRSQPSQNVLRNGRFQRLDFVVCPGFFYDLTGDFNNSFHFAGVIILASAVLLYPLNCIDRWQKRRTKKTTGRV